MLIWSHWKKVKCIYFFKIYMSGGSQCFYLVESGNKGGHKLAEVESGRTAVLAFRRQVLKAERGEAATLFICLMSSKPLRFPASCMTLGKLGRGLCPFRLPGLWTIAPPTTCSSPGHWLLSVKRLLTAAQLTSVLNLFPVPCLSCKPGCS